MVDAWIRSTNTNVNNFGVAGFSENISLGPGQTALRTFWNIGLTMLWVNPGQYPPGSSILRVGLAWDESGRTAIDAPFPIFNGDDRDWMDIETIPPYSVVLASAVDNIWVLNWGFQKDEDVRSMRKNDNVVGDQGLYVSWEVVTDGAIAGFSIDQWHSSTDCLIRVP